MGAAAGASASASASEGARKCERCGYCAHTAFHGNPAWVADQRAKYGDGESARHCCHRCMLGLPDHGAFCQRVRYVEPKKKLNDLEEDHARRYGTMLYHQTDAATARIILQRQEMKPGTKGLAGGGIYFATTAASTSHKAVKQGIILQAYVSLGKILTLEADGDKLMTPEKLNGMHYDSVCIARKVSSGHEYVVYDPKRVLLIEKA